MDKIILGKRSCSKMRIKYSRFGVVVLILLGMAMAANAATFNINITGIVKHDGTPIDNNATVTAYIGGVDNPTKLGTCGSALLKFHDAGMADITSNLKISGGSIVFSGLSDQVSGGNSIYLRIWENGTDVFSLSSYYVDLGYTLKGTPTEDFIQAFNRGEYYCNYYPPVPTIAMDSTNPEKLSRQGLVVPAVYSLQLNYVVTGGTAYRARVDTYEVEVVKKPGQGTPAGGDWPASKDNIIWFDSAGSTPVNNFYVGGQWYYLRARGVNQLGPEPTDTTTGWSDPAEYQSASGGGGGALTATYPLKGPISGQQFGINTFGLSLDIGKGPITDGAINVPLKTAGQFSVYDIIKEINKQANENRVQVFGYYDTTVSPAQITGITNISYASTTPGADIASATPIPATGNVDAILSHQLKIDKEAYQVSLTKSADAGTNNFDFTLKGYK